MKDGRRLDRFTDVLEDPIDPLTLKQEHNDPHRFASFRAAKWQALEDALQEGLEVLPDRPVQQGGLLATGAIRGWS